MYQMLVDRAYIPCHGEGLLEYLKSCVHVSVWHLENPDVKQNTMWEKKRKEKEKRSLSLQMRYAIIVHLRSTTTRLTT